MVASIRTSFRPAAHGSLNVVHDRGREQWAWCAKTGKSDKERRTDKGPPRNASPLIINSLLVNNFTTFARDLPCKHATCFDSLQESFS